MTAEIVIMNKNAIVFASDSAATTENMVYYDEEKIFNVSHEINGYINPIVLMYYNGAEFLGTPWNSLIKNFRNIINTSAENNQYKSLQDYQGYFKDYLKQKEETTKRTLIENILINSFKELRKTENFLNDNYLKKQCKKINMSEINRALEENLGNNLIAGSMDLLNEEIRKNEIPNEKAEKIILICQNKMINNSSFKKVYKTGLVIGGFGIEDDLPSFISFEVKISVEKGLEVEDVKPYKLTQENDIKIVPFADVVYLDIFLNGIDKKITENMFDYLERILSKEKLEKKRIDEIIVELKENQVKFIKSEHKDVIESAIDTLSKNQLARLAENLITTEILRKNYSADERKTVGGKTVVAIISKGDGFEWYKK